MCFFLNKNRCFFISNEDYHCYWSHENIISQPSLLVGCPCPCSFISGPKVSSRLSIRRHPGPSIWMNKSHVNKCYLSVTLTAPHRCSPNPPPRPRNQWEEFNDPQNMSTNEHCHIFMLSANLLIPLSNFL